MSRDRTKVTLWFLTLGAVLAWSAIRPHDYFTWFLEVLPAFLGIGILAITYRRFRFTDLVYGLIWIHAAILMVGGHYTYAQMPLFNWIRDTFHLMRNDYDRLGHFAQGFVPALIAREFLLRMSSLKRGKLLAFLVVSICLAFSALYELFEWQMAVSLGPRTNDFLGTQGDVWDTQEDMATCLVGSIVSLLLMSRIHDRALQKLGILPAPPSPSS
jgi:putative membrane protein